MPKRRKTGPADDLFDEPEDSSPGVGHNSIASDQLRTIVERIETLEEEKKAVAEDIKEVYAEAKGNGFDAKILRKIVVMRRKDAADREEEQAMLDLYLNALGML